MHELSIAMSLIELASNELKKNGGSKILALNVKLGPLSGVVKEALLAAYQLAVSETDMSGAVLNVEDVPVTVFCSDCSQISTLPGNFGGSLRFVCGYCGKATSDVRSGADLDLVSMEID